MKLIKARNVQQAFPMAMELLSSFGREKASRNGSTLEIPCPVATVYRYPMERVLFYPERDANPFFHLMESLWMLAGRNDVAWLAQFNSKIGDYSDDGVTFNAAYGHRLRRHFHRDQLAEAVEQLQRDPDDRRVVCQIWDVHHDFHKDSVDIPCNDLIMFKIRDGNLWMTVCNRSNDAIWGCYGANAVHFSFIQEYVAGMIGVEVGPYTQVSDSLHVYETPQWEKCKGLGDLLNHPHPRPRLEAHDPYTLQEVVVRPLMDFSPFFDKELALFMSGQFPESYSWENKFFPEVAVPMYNAWFARKSRDDAEAIKYLRKMPEGNDWCQAAYEWIRRRA